MAYRKEALVPHENDAVSVGRHEYAHLRRAAELLDLMEDGVDLDYDGLGGGRYRWKLYALGEYTDYGRTREEGRGPTLQEAAEIAFELPPVEPWYPDPPRRVPWFRLMLAGALLGHAIPWAIRYFF